MTNDDVLESWHQGEFVFGHLAIFRGTYKTNTSLGQKDSAQDMRQDIFVISNVFAMEWQHKVDDWGTQFKEFPPVQRHMQDVHLLPVHGNGQVHH